MEKPKMEWIDNIFNCLEIFYGKRWSKQFDQFMPIDLAKTVWQSALCGCTYDEIRNVLVLLKQAAKSASSEPPHYLEFYRYTKGAKPPMPIETLAFRGDPEIARAAIADIRSRLPRASHHK
jgi:hypothetical protein